MRDLTWGPLLLAAYGAVVAPIAVVRGGRRLDAALAWMFEGRPSTLDERCRTVLLPRTFVVESLWIWTGGNVTFAVANAVNGDSAPEILRSFIGSTLGAATTAALCYVLIERHLRAIFALVLADGPLPVRTVGVRQRMALAWALGSGIPLASIASSPLDGYEESVTEIAVLAAMSFVAGGILIGAATRSVSDRLTSVRTALGRVRAGDLSVEVDVDEAGEIGTLQAGVNAMVFGLRERQVIADLFGRYVGDDVARHALEAGVHLGGERRHVSVLFIDVTGSTELAATRPPEEVVATLNQLFAIVVRVVGEEQGWVDKFEGDAALCVFGAPMPLEDHPRRALRAARRLRAAIRHLDVGIGVSSGDVVAGNVGAEARFEYTVIGDPVNEAARLTEAAKSRPGRVLAACRTIALAGHEEGQHWQAAESILLRGRPQPTDTCEPVA